MKRLRAGLAATLIALSLSFGLAVQPSAAVAPALVVAPPPVPPSIVGAIPAAGGAAVSGGAACVASVVCLGAVGVAAAAVGLYATRDTWVPALSRLIDGDGEPDAGSSPIPGLSGTSASLAVTLEGISGETGESWAVRFTDTGSYAATSYGAEVDVLCRIGTTGAYTFSVAGWYGNYARPTSWTKSGSCGTGNTVVGLISHCHRTQYKPCPGTHFRWGSTDFPNDDELTYSATSRCVLPDGTTQDLTIDYQGQPGNEIGFMIPSCAAAGLGNHADSVDVVVKYPGGSSQPRPGWTVTPTADPLYPLCDPNVPDACILSVYVDGTVCAVGDARCVNWAEAATSRLECHWGPYTVPIARCAILERAYQVGGSTITDTTVDGDPTTGTSTGTDTGTSFPTQVPIPLPGGDSPVPDPADPEVGDVGCWPTGTAAWNPVEWVLRPVQCALVWAFVPEGGLDTRTQALGDAWGASDVGQWVQDVGGVAGTVGTGVSGVSGCEGPVWNIALGGNDYRFAPLDACVAPMSNIAPWVKAGVGALVVLAGVRAVVRPITRSLDLPSAPGV